jgi:putative ABC transport system permease protein
MPPRFRVGTLDIDVYYPLPLDRNKPEAVGSRSFQCFGRLRPGIGLDEARAEMTLIADQIGHEIQGEKGWRVQVSDLRDALVRDHRLSLLLLLGVVAFVLLIACANLAGLLLTRSVGRRSELALRASLGASRFRLVQQLVVESLVLAGLGGALGLFLGAAASRGLVLLAKDAVEFGQMADVRLDVSVLAFTVALSLVTAVLFGLVPAWQVSVFNLQAVLAERGRGGSDSRGQHRLRAAIMTGEIALAVVLLAGSGLLLRTFANLLQVKLGFEPEQVLTMSLFLTDDAPGRANIVERILERVETLPGVRAVGTIQFLPLSGWTNNGPFHFVGRPKPTDPMHMASDVSTVSRGYFEAMGIELVRGRSFDLRDRMQSPRVAVVNQAFVEQYSPHQDPLGQVILGDWANPRPTEIVGIVGDIRHNGVTTEPRPTVFLAQAQVPGYITYVVVRTSSDLQGMAAAVRREIQQVDPRQALSSVQPMRQYVSAALARPRLYATLLGAFAALALVLSAVGLYGLMAYTVSRRTHEIGIRMALGARGADVLRSILAQGARLAVTGVAAGTLCAMALSRLLTALLYGVSPSDPLTYVGAIVVLGGVALAAALVPARRASRVDPILALRYD